MWINLGGAYINVLNKSLYDRYYGRQTVDILFDAAMTDGRGRGSLNRAGDCARSKWRGRGN
jgi:hypothetical protein